MLSIQEVSRLLGDDTKTDEEIEEIRDGLRILAEIAYEKWLLDRKKARRLPKDPTKQQ